MATVESSTEATTERSQKMTGKRYPSCLSVEEGYKRWAPTYDSAPNPLLALEQRCLTPLLPKLVGKNVLDLACGTGRWLEILLRMGPKVGVGIDVSSAMLEVAQKKPALAGVLTRAECTRLPFTENSFDLVVFSFALGHIADLERLASELVRVMKPHSDLYVTDLHPQAYEAGWRTGFRDETSAAEIQQQFRSLTSIVERFQSAGFSPLHILSCTFDRPERPVFDRAGRGHRFEELREIPAIFICHFKRNATSDTGIEKMG
jgi:ubiquinone/menaquinone biosynthesis C-methylase UbiE